MKYLVLLCDGMSDEPVFALGGKTPMETAHKPNMDKLAKMAVQGLVKTVADNMKPGSDVANLSVLGYEPEKYYSGRSPLEAGSIGIDMKPTDISFRCNLVTLSDEPEYADKTMLDYCAGDIHTDEAKVLIEHINKHLGKPPFSFYSGVCYRHCLLWNDGLSPTGDIPDKTKDLTPPHDITDKRIISYLPAATELADMMRASYALLKEHPINIKRIKNGKKPANSIWLWGEGVRKELPSFKEKYGLNGTMISAVDLLKGIGKFTCMNVVEVEGATGYIDTNFDGKVQAAINALKSGDDFVYLHIEAPDECAHRGEVENKVKSIELIDELVLAPFLKALNDEHFKILICPDHPTPLELRTHTNEPVPFLIYDNKKQSTDNSQGCFTETTAKNSGVYFETGPALMRYFLA